LGILNTSGLFESTNPAWFATLGYEAEEIESRPFIDFVHQDDIPRTEKAFENIQNGKPVLRFRNRYRHKDGSFRWLSWNCVPEGGKFYCSARDVTSSVENRLALTSQEEEARLREQFIAVLGHDLRNPLAALQSGFYLIAKEELSDRGKAVIKAGQRSIDRMSGLIDALMDFARTRLGSGLSLDVSDGKDLREAIEATVEEIRVVHPDIPIDSRCGLEADVRCDVGRISQLCSNLISNAVAHGDGRTAVRLVAESDESGLEITVSNRGETMPKRVIAHLFEPFVREQVRPSQEGLGLGLFICSEIAKAHGGTLSVESADGLTIFTFNMPHDLAQGEA
jgi:sigma-B regulation protein RsbU (phosphoserine phosphatase)